MTSAQLINQTSGKVEYYTPQAIIEAARRAMGSKLTWLPKEGEPAWKIFDL